MAEIEEHYILRVPDAALADRLRSMLREEPAAQPADKEMQLTFESAHCFRNVSGFPQCARSASAGDPRQGTFKVGDDEFPVFVRDLPTIVETYKTYDDMHLVKCTDVGQAWPRRLAPRFTCRAACWICGPNY